MSMAFDPLISSLSTIFSALVFFAYETRPSGGLAVDEDSDVVAKPSTIPNAGLGLFAARDLEAGTVLGTYPGRVWSAATWLRFKGLEPGDLLLDTAERAKLQEERQRRAEVFTWKLGKEIDSDDGDNAADPGATSASQAYTATFVLDPTDSGGQLLDNVPWVLNTFATVPTLLCRINEPGPGGDVNVVAEETDDSVRFLLERAVRAGEELFIDYGPFYDRSGYSPLAAPGRDDKVRDAVRKVLDAALQQQVAEGGRGAARWDYAQFLLAVDAGKVVAVQFSADGSRCVAVDDADVRVEVDGLPPDSDILDMLAQRQVDVSVLPE